MYDSFTVCRVVSALMENNIADHSHNMGQYPDGLRGPLIVQDPFDPYKDQYTDEEILIISDWYGASTCSTPCRIGTNS